jgi:protein gp37
MNPDWVRSIRDQCVAAGVPFFFKQWGEYAPTFAGDTYPKYFENVPANDGTGTHHRMFRVGKKAAGRLLDGRTWDEGPADDQMEHVRAAHELLRIEVLGQ